MQTDLDNQETIPLNTESSSEAVLDMLFTLKVKDVMSKNIYTASSKETFRTIQQLMREKKITGVPIVDDGKLAGIVSMENIITAFDTNIIDEPCENYMTKNIIVLQADMSLSFAVSYFNKYKFGRFPVLNAENQIVGIVSTKDVISALLFAMNKEVERLEKKAEIAQTILQSEPNKKIPNNDTRIIEFKTEPFNFETAGQASTEVKKILKSMSIDPALTRRIGIASYELEINQVVHSEGGIMRYFISPTELTIEAQDIGPGIPDLTKALTEGFSTATDRVRALGFGAGMGLPNTKRVSDNFDIESSIGKGTTVHAWFNLEEQK